MAAVLLVAVVVMGLYWIFTGYRTFTQSWGDDHFSFEIPARFVQTMNQPRGQEAPSAFRFVGLLSDGSYIVMKMNISRTRPDLEPAARAERLLSPADELLERSWETIDGVPCVVQARLDVFDLYSKEVFFEHDDRAWHCYVNAHGEHRDQVETVFDHVFDTFEFRA